MTKPPKGRRDRLRTASVARPSSLRRPPLGDGFVLSTDGRHMLRAIREHISDRGEFAGSNVLAAELAGVSVEQAARALSELGSRGFVRLRRRPETRNA